MPDRREKPPTKPPVLAISRVVTPKDGPHPLGTPRAFRPGVLAVEAWLLARGLFVAPTASWTIDVALDVVARPPSFQFTETVDTCFHFHISPHDWRYTFCHAARVSEVRIVEGPAVVGRDEHQIVAATPSLANIGVLVRLLEQRHRIFFHRALAAIESTLPSADPSVRAWVASF